MELRELQKRTKRPWAVRTELREDWKEKGRETEPSTRQAKSSWSVDQNLEARLGNEARERRRVVAERAKGGDG